MNVGGTERMLLNIAKYLNVQIKHTILSLHSQKNKLAGDLPSHVIFEKTDRGKGIDWSVARKIRQLIVRDHTDVILAFGLFEFFYCKLAMLGMRKRIPLLLSIHSTGFVTLKQLVQRWFFARFLNRHDFILAVCHAQVKYWREAYQISSRMFRVIYNGVDTTFFSPDNCFGLQDVRKEYSIPITSFVIVQVASLTPHKRHEDTIRALAYVTKMRPDLDIYVFLVGKGDERRELYLRKLVNQAGLSKRILFCGIHSDVRPFLASANLFTLTSSAETFSVAALEAMSMGLPVVLTDVAGAKEMVIEGVNGYLVMPENPQSIADGWLKVVENKNALSPVKIRQHVIDKFDLKDCVRQYENAILDAIANN
jgi:glycosyltransferase involved in cell wall biosynthesis